jgi:uncharacterized damage-inducible protein DinB
MNSRIPGFRGEFLWELEIAQTQLLALANAFPAEDYGWKPAEDARSFSRVLVHVAAGNFSLLRLAGFHAAESLDLYGPLEGEPLAQFAAVIRKNISLEKTVTEKQAVIDLLQRSFQAVSQSLTECGDEQLECAGEFFGGLTTVRRVCLRILAHAHEHMGQAIAYLRSNGIAAPWPDPLKLLDRIPAEAGTR